MFYVLHMRNGGYVMNEVTTDVVEIKTDEAASLSSGEKRCAHCGTLLAESQQFCPHCGKKIGNEKKPISKKTKQAIIGASAGAVLLTIIIVFAVYLLPNIILPKVNLSRAVNAFESLDYAKAVVCYEKSGFAENPENIDNYTYSIAMTKFDAGEYQEAAATFNNANMILDCEDKIFECGVALTEAENYDNAAECFALLASEKAIAHKAYCDGMVAYNAEDYATAVTQLEASSSEIDHVADFLPQVYFEYGKALLDDEYFASAIKYFEKAGEYPEAKTYVTGAALLRAESTFRDGELNNAKKEFAALPQDFSFEGIKVADRVKALNNASAFMAICGEWTATSNYIESRNVYKSSGSWDCWYIDGTMSSQKLEIRCVMNDDGTFTIKGKVSFYRFTDYSSLKAYCQATSTTRNFTISNVTKMPSSYKIDSNTTLYYSNGKFSLEYYVRDDYSVNFYNKYTSSVTYGKRSETY